MAGDHEQDASHRTPSPSGSKPQARPPDKGPVRPGRLLPLLLDLRRLIAVLRSQHCRPLRLAASPVLERLGAEWLDRLAERLDGAIELFESLHKPSRRTKT